MSTTPQTLETTFETYFVEGTLGEGGTGFVYAVRTPDGQDLAAKCLKSECANRERSRRFQNEIAFCRDPPHENIVRVLDDGFIGEGDLKRPFYVMRHYPSTLADVIPAADPDQGLQLFAKILDGVEAAHLRGVWHRDLKPKNVLIELERNEVVVADFGIARFAEPLLVAHVETKKRSRLANFEYAAPEQRRASESVNASADIFALGLILNELFTGELPLGTDFRLIADASPSHGYLDDVVDAMIRREPAKRPTIQQVKQLLISREVEFVALQKVDQISKQVVPKSTVVDPLVANPLEIVSIEDFDPTNSRLRFRLNTAPNKRWIELFRDPPKGGVHKSHGSVLIAPETCNFEADVATLPANAGTAQKAVELMKGYV
ncbi:MAG: serine/threonine protein kinase, partial [Acidobacteria bacterium]|nr:serine/threonine protein kinase [Acidobacteriota bacterium]